MLKLFWFARADADINHGHFQATLILDENIQSGEMADIVDLVHLK